MQFLIIVSDADGAQFLELSTTFVDDNNGIKEDHRDRYLGALFRVDKLKLTCPCDSFVIH